MTAPAPPPPPPPEPPSAASILAARQALSSASLLPILDGFAHRNKNQHAASHWWRELCLLRRRLRALASTGGDAAAFAQRARWLRDRLLPRAYLSFTQLAADNQYAPLGLALVAVLAKVHAVITELLPPELPLPPPQQQQKSKQTAAIASKSEVVENISMTDRGVAVARTPALVAKPPAPASPSVSKRATDSTQANLLSGDADPDRKAKKRKSDKKKKKKKKKSSSKGDELASLFGSLT